MKHTSEALENTIEIINITPFNPLISKCQIKVCYVSDKPNRNKSIITKEVATEMANSLPGSPIVGYYNENEEDFEEHNRIIEISNGKFRVKDTTKPYGFVDLNAKVWFQKYLDDEQVEREYLVTEGWLWTGQYPECQRIIEHGNNQSMELDENHLDATWTKDNNGKPQFFIINEAIINKLCILGEEAEPCFEGSSITKPNITFALEDDFKEKLFSMMNELKEYLTQGGEQVFTRYAVDIGDALWTALYKYLEDTYPDTSESWQCSIYRIDGIYEENSQKFAIIQDRKDMKYYRLNFELNDGFAPAETLIEVTKTYVPSEEPQFPEEAVKAYAETLKNSSEEQDKTDEEENNKSDNTSEDENNTEFSKKENEDEEEEKCPECGKPLSECECEHEDDKKKYSLEEIPEYVELQSKYSELETKYNALLGEKESLEAQVKPLSEFKAQIEKKEKEDMIAQFYMLSDEDKKDVIDNIDTYSLEDIEAKLSVICVRNKVSFSSLEENQEEQKPTTYTLNDTDDDNSVPAWVKRAMEVAKEMQ